MMEIEMSDAKKEDSSLDATATEDVAAAVMTGDTLHSSSKQLRVWWSRRTWIVALVIFAIGLTVGLTVGLTGRGSNKVSSSSNQRDAHFIADRVEAVAAQKGLSFTPQEITATSAQDTTLYQSKALRRLEEMTFVLDYTDERLGQIYALLCLYYSTNKIWTDATDQFYGYGTVPRWVDTRHWNDNSDECSWFGVFCDANNKVTKIDLTGNRLSGHLPVELRLLPDSLAAISVAENPGLGSGGVPAFLTFIASTKFKTISIRGCSYKGTVPAPVCQAFTTFSVVFLVDCDQLTCSCCTCSED